MSAILNEILEEQGAGVWAKGFTDDRSKYRFKHAGHKFTLFKRAGSPNWQVKFRNEGRQVLKSLETTNVDAARQRAITHYKEVTSARWEDREAAERRKRRSDFATIGQIVAAYKAQILIHKRIEDSTIRGNVAKLATVLREGLGMQCRLTAAQLQEDVVQDVRDLRCSVLNRDLVKKFQEGRRKVVMKLDRVAQERANLTMNSILRQARSVFSRSALECYRGMKLPDLDGFMKTPLVDEHHEVAYRPISPAVLEQMEKAIAKVKESDANLYLAFKLCLYCGLRNDEAVHARPAWLVKQTWKDTESKKEKERWVLAVINRPDFETKNGVERMIPVVDELAEEIRTMVPAKGPGQAQFILDLPTPTQREDVLSVNLNGWLRKYLPRVERQKATYELRKHFGSVIAAKYGLEAAQYQLGHRSIVTTQSHYASYLQSLQVQAITTADILPTMRMI